jgi:hypothetical protein
MPIKITEREIEILCAEYGLSQDDGFWTIDTPRICEIGSKHPVPAMSPAAFLAVVINKTVYLLCDHLEHKGLCIPFHEAASKGSTKVPLLPELLTMEEMLTHDELKVRQYGLYYKDHYAQKTSN